MKNFIEQPIQTPEQKIQSILDNEPALEFIDELKKELPKLEFYLVGGMVRDILMNNEKNSKDFDFVAKNISIDELIKALQKLGDVNLVGKNFGVLKFNPTGTKLSEAIDIALPRKEFCEGTGGYHDVETQSDEKMDIEEDLSRRDLTINAIAYNVTDQTLIDPYNGKKDIQDEIIRAVGKPESRFKEDYSRMLRALRFACKLNFRIDKDTWLAIKKLIVHLNDEKFDQDRKRQRLVPLETISKELLKMLQSNPSKALELLDQSGALEQILPEMITLKGCEQPAQFHNEGDVWQHTKLMVDSLSSDQFRKQFPKAKITGSFVLGILLHDIGKPETRQEVEKDGQTIAQFHGHDILGEEIVCQIATRLKLNKQQKEKIKFLTRQHMFAMTVKNINDVSANKFAQRFIDSEFSEELLMLFYLDSLCSKRPDNSSPMGNFNETMIRIKEFKKIREKQSEKIISGEQIMKTFSLKGGPFIGFVNYLLNELKNLGKINSPLEALRFLESNKELLATFITEPDIFKKREEIIENILTKIDL